MRYVIVLVSIVFALIGTQPTRADVEVTLSRAAEPLNGPWAFRFGNDPRWAAPEFDDHDWERVDLTPAPGAHDGDVGLPRYVPGWAARGHAGRFGHAWYRLRVHWAVPIGSAPVLVAPTLVDDAYEVYWNGKLIGGIGDFSKAKPRIFGVHPLLLPLGDGATTGEGVLAIHVFLSKQSASGPEAGGIHVAPILAERSVAAALVVEQWWRTFWGYVVDLVEPLALLTLALFALSLWRFAPGDRFLPLAAGAISAIALSRINQPLYFWTQAETLDTLIIARFVLFNPLAIVLWVLACNRLGGYTDRRVDAAACLAGLLAGIAAFPGLDVHLLKTVSRIFLLGLYCWSLWHVVRAARPKILVVAIWFAMGTALFAEELSAIAVAGIWFPFGVGVSRTQFALALAIPLLAVLVHLHVRPVPRPISI